LALTPAKPTTPTQGRAATQHGQWARNRDGGLDCTNVPESVAGAGMVDNILGDHTAINWIDELVGAIRIGNHVEQGPWFQG